MTLQPLENNMIAYTCVRSQAWNESQWRSLFLSSFICFVLPQSFPALSVSISHPYAIIILSMSFSSLLFYSCPSMVHPYCLFVFYVSIKSISLYSHNPQKKTKSYYCLLPTLSPSLLHANLYLFTFILQVLIWNSLVSLECYLQLASGQDQQPGQC